LKGTAKLLADDHAFGAQDRLLIAGVELCDHGHEVVVIHVPNAQPDVTRIDGVSPWPKEIAQIGLSICMKNDIVIGQPEGGIGV
jgi:hypothetical protein